MDSVETGKKLNRKGILLICIFVLCIVAVVMALLSTRPQNTNCTAVITVQDYGVIRVALDAKAAPKTVEQFVSLAECGFYDGTTFHRIMKGFMIQGGSTTADGKGSADTSIFGEFSSNGYSNPLSFTRGAIGFARSTNYDSGSSQFFIMHQDKPALDGLYACFGYVTEGMDVVDAIAETVPTADDNGSVLAANQSVITSIVIQK